MYVSNLLRNIYVYVVIETLKCFECLKNVKTKQKTKSA